MAFFVVILYFFKTLNKKVAQTETIWAILVNSSTPINCEVR